MSRKQREGADCFARAGEMPHATPDDLLAGPRGRRMLLELILARAEVAGTVEQERLRSAVSEVDSLYPPETVDIDGIASAIRSVGTPEVTDDRLIQAVSRSVDAAMYWQPPDGLDRLCRLPGVREALRGAAEHVAAAEAVGRWGSGFEPDEQVWVRFHERPAPGESVTTGRPREKLASGTTKLGEWHSTMEASEKADRLQRDRDVRAPFSGDWWSAPVFLAEASCRRLPDAGATGLWWIEDAFGPEYAELFGVKVDPGARILEVRGADDWVQLCQKYPLEVTWSRRHDWYRVTGRDGRWAMPDWSRVAADYDGVHLTALGYLNTAGRAIEVSGELAAVLSGWNPGETYWLNNRARVLKEAERWEGGTGNVGQRWWRRTE